MAASATASAVANASFSSLQDSLDLAADSKPPPDMPPLVLSKSDFASLQDVSQRIKAIREPIRDLMRCANISASADYAAQKSAGADKRGLLLSRLNEQLEATQLTLKEYLLQIPGASTHPALTRTSPYSGGQNRNRSSTHIGHESATYRLSRPPGLFSPDSYTSQYTPPPVPSLPTPSSRASDDTRPASSSAERASALAKSPSVRIGAAAASRQKLQPPSISDAGEGSVEGSVVRLWQSDNVKTAPAKPVNDVYVKLGKRHIAPLEERIPHIPTRELSSHGNSHIGVVDLINSLLRSSATENEVSHLTKQIETLPPGIMACTIANSTAQLFQQLTADTVKQYAASTTTATNSTSIKNSQLQNVSSISSRNSTSSNASSGSGNSASDSRSSSSSPSTASAQSILRMLSDHANFLTRFMEATIIYPIHASQRAKRIEWWTVVACILRELGDYESLNSLICVFSTAIIGRLRASWDLVSSKCKNAIRFILERVLKIHPNYGSYRSELQARIRRMQKKKKKADGAEARAAALATMLDNNKAMDSREEKAEDESLDFDSAIAINTPDLCSSNDNYVNSGVYCKEEFDLPPPRALVPIVAVLLKDAVSSEVSGDSVNSDRRPASSQTSNTERSMSSALQWTAIIESCYNQDLPLSLDYFMMRRIFSTEMSSLSLLMPSANQQSLTPRAFSAASNFLKRMPRRQSSTDKHNGSKELTLSQCRLLGDSAISASRAPHIVDILAHFLYISAGNPCYSCSVGAPLEKLHVSTSGQLAVVVATVLLFSEPWMPREYLMRLCDMREPRLSGSTSSRSPPVGTSAATISAATQPAAASRISMSSHSQGYESRSAERPWLMSFKLSDSIDYSRYSKNKHASHINGNITSNSCENDNGTSKDSSKHSSIESARKISTDSESTCVNRAPSPNGFTNPDKEHRGGTDQMQLSSKSPAVSENSRKSGHRRSSSSHSIQLNGAKSALSAISPNLPELPPLPSNANLPPLPSATMPRWLPSDAAASSKSPQSSIRLREKSPMLVLEALPPPPPPLPRQPMPRFQPEKDAISPPPPIQTQTQQPQVAKSPRLTAAQPAQTIPGGLSAMKKKAADISAETQMLLNFDTGASGS
ncbi:Ras guanine nucleotide exchange factor bud5 [Coemansia sp. RSA 1813]|nr:Ras guanine nucleotide exchange factor bud5 [Coemansia sp. RSA 1646]KAJ1772114.1 Ras guanine nucleotide exchange factor bud5 [Coemansia sp. RSA 1843]KAJ2088342.1 Ras guanine nucleotide exchange factor bud5 [Coemansia sp. RSA 986]KAJ2213320.1 Ras guanine nucleotide exchange factor bud5 [Coemansia sp. RSA 487]KAJ2568196.1 Ras guanine nucleotide exchange factor bud5 [Coemansia sp. RSA 1813]